MKESDPNKESINVFTKIRRKDDGSSITQISLGLINMISLETYNGLKYTVGDIGKVKAA